MYIALATLPDGVREPFVTWAHAVWRQFDDEVWDAAISAARKPNRQVRIGEEDLPLRDAAGQFIWQLRNLVHGYNVDNRNLKVWRAMQETVPYSLSDVLLSLYLAFLADPLRYYRVREVSS